MPEPIDWKPKPYLGPDAPQDIEGPLEGPGKEDGRDQVSDNELEAFTEIADALADDPAIPQGPGRGQQVPPVADDQRRALDFVEEQYRLPPEDQL